MSDMLKELMEAEGPCLSTELTKLLVERGLSSEAARQRVSRGCVGLKRLAHLTFPRKARFLYLEKDYGSPEYWNALTNAILAGDSSYNAALAALLQRDGIMPKAHFWISCGAPLRQKKHLSPEAIFDRFQKAGIVKEIDVPGIGACIAFAPAINRKEPDISSLRARLVTEAILLKAIKMWLRNLGFASFDKIALRDDDIALPQVGTFAWDLSGPSYLAPMIEWKSEGKPAPGFIACDVLLGSEITEIGFRPFAQKCTTLRSLKRIGRCLQIFVAESYSQAAFSKAKGMGIIPATPETLFGKEVAQGLKQLTDILTQAAKASVKPEVFNELFQRLDKIEGAATNLRGALFEFIVAALVRHHIGGATITLNKIFKNEAGEQAEVDVLAVQSNRAVYFIECKGYQPSGVVEDDDVERWLTKRISLVRQEALKHPDWKSLELHFEFWTTGKLSAAAIAKVEEMKANTRKYTIDYRDAASVYEYAKEVKDKSLLLTLRQHFLEHPMATADRDVEERAAREERDRERRAKRELATEE